MTALSSESQPQRFSAFLSRPISASGETGETERDATPAEMHFCRPFWLMLCGELPVVLCLR
jgi:hypothetical protein